MITATILAMSLMVTSAAQPMTIKATWYCPCHRCCGPHSPEVGGHGLTTSGDHPIEGMTIAAPRGIPMGTVLCIEGVGVRVVQDRGGAIKGHRIDVFTQDHQAALEHGVHELQAWVLAPYDSQGVVACETGAME